MASGANGPGDVLRHSEDAIDPPGFVNCFASAGKGEKIVLGGGNQVWLGSKGDHVINEVEAHLELIRELLFCILRPGAFELVLPIGDIASRCGCLHAVIERRKISCDGAAARAPRHSDVLRIHFRQGRQQIDGADTIPNHVAGNTLAGQETLDAEHLVLYGAAACLGIFQRGIVKDPPLALPKRVIGEHDEAGFYESECEGLIKGPRFRRSAVAGRPKHGRKGLLAVLWYIEVPRYEEARRAFENDFLNLESVLSMAPVRCRFNGVFAVGRPPTIFKREFRARSFAAMICCGVCNAAVSAR